MITRTSGANPQALAAEFRPGDVVVPYGANRDYAGRVVQVWPAIGMIDVEFPAGTKRYPVEDILRLDHSGNPDPPRDGYVPGGITTVSVPGGPYRPAVVPPGSPERVASAYMKTALYWAARDRQYRATSEEISSGKYGCPKCKKAQLRKAIYRRIKGQSEHLYGCPSCLFLIARESLIHPQVP